MDKINSTSRLFSLESKVLLIQTDTTVGFLSQDESKLQSIKERASTKPFIKVYKSFKALKNAKQRVPSRQKRLIRRAKKTTFIVKSTSFRIAKDTLHSKLLTNITWNYSTSANERSKNFNRIFCEEKTDIIIEDKDSLYEGKSSKLYKINNIKKVRLR
ncbi:TsaC protein (YrdC domain) required for threonylcarbamoyladenosine t(6)A37 modification in tRNA [hydrothermal vent metagenome]|uniref:TsaC protein (YrdC domain) required for threonylcarbamoyladenosine t(6)A37 modification in tRNA n=1 Tax=hydrothermal vent metagenome TaxID=652676 RepID=A0A1W1CN74_9ZZZZ